MLSSSPSPPQTSNNDQDSSNNLSLNLNPNFSQVSFHVKYETNFGEHVYIIGNIEELGSWDTNKAVRLSTTKENYPEWQSTIDIICPVGMEIDYKYFVKFNQTIKWEEFKESKNLNRHIAISTPGKFIIYDEKGSLIPKIKNTYHQTFPYQMYQGNILTNQMNYTNIIDTNINQLSNLQRDICSFDFADTKFTESGINEIVSYENNQLNSMDDYNENYFLNGPTKLTNDDRIIIASALLPFEIDINTNAKDERDKYIIRPTDEQLLYLILFGIKEKNFCEVMWIGMLRNAYQYNEEQLKEINTFLKKNNIYMVTVSEIDYTNYWIYINQILSPVFVQSAIDIKNEYFLNHDKYFTAFHKVNIAFGNIIKDNNLLSENDLIMINDIHLALIPNTIIQGKINTRIGMYFHICIPSSEVLRSFPHHDALIKSVLLCDVIGFHIFRYARNFLSALNQEFGINYEVKSKGNIIFKFLGRDILIHIRHAGIDLDYINTLTKSNLYQTYINKYKPLTQGKTTLVSIDNPLEINQVLIKLEAYKCYLTKHPELKGKIILIQVIDYDKSENKERKLTPYVNKICQEIIDSFGKESLHIENIDSITAEEQLALFDLSDILFIMQMWNGICTLASQFISLKQGNALYGMIVNESVGVSPAIKSAIRVNAFNKNDVVKAMESIFKMNDKERMKLYEHDMKYIKENSTFNWIQTFFVNLKKVALSHSTSMKYGLGIGLNFRVMKLNSNFSHLKYETLFNSFIQSNYRLFFLDYENTLINTNETYSSTYNNNNNLKLDDKLVSLLSNLTRDPKNKVYIITTNKKDFLSETFKDVENIGLAAEYGFFYKPPQEKDYTKYETLFNIKDWTWRDTVMKILQKFQEKTEGSYIEVKEATLGLVYKKCDNYFGNLQATELTNHLNNIFEGDKLDIINELDCVEIKPKNVNKGYFISHIIQKELNEGRPPDFVIAVGSGESNEEMFKYLTSLETQLKKIGKNISTYGVTVGKKPSSAKYYLKGVNQILLYLDSLAHKDSTVSN